MARGFESKSVEDQQLDAQDAKDRLKVPPGGGPSSKRRTLQLARADILNRLESAQSEAHKGMLRAALESLDKDLAATES
jgi:hypothetical protein